MISRRLIGDGVITTSFSFIVSSNCILYDSAKPAFADMEPDAASIDPNLIEDAITFRYMTRVGVDEPTPERQSAVRDHVRRRFQFHNHLTVKEIDYAADVPKRALGEVR